MHHSPGGGEQGGPDRGTPTVTRVQLCILQITGARVPQCAIVLKCEASLGLEARPELAAPNVFSGLEAGPIPDLRANE